MEASESSVEKAEDHDVVNSSEAPSNGSSSRPTKRAAAKQQLVETWQSHRRQSQSSPAARRAPSPPTTSLCYVLKQSWDQIWQNFQLAPRKPSAAAKKDQTKKKRTEQASQPPRESSKSFPSVLSILQATALVKQVEQLQQDEDLLLSILPTGYDWNQAILKMAASRPRAFFLLDLAAVIRTLVQWMQYEIQFLYQIQSNADSQLLQVLQDQGVGLIATTKWDLEHCLDSASIYDNASVTGKPDGYVRTFVQKNPDEACTMAVDGPDEVHRIQASLERFRQRKQRRMARVNFLLRLPEVMDQWKTCLQETLQAIQDTGDSSQLVGVSMHLADDEPRDGLLFGALRELLAFWKEISLMSETKYLRIDLTGLVQTPFADHVVTEWKRLTEHELVGQVTVDISRLLVAPSGALCTRIIGVRHEQDAQGTVRRHYYIDDGCYGSLYQAGKGDASFCPLPLVSRPADDKDDVAVHLSTVWGPTCDGLDRVCRDIPLPELSRDDWLVFPQLGCSSSQGLGTAFNGFDPPDTAYCVLGYFK